MVTSLTVYPNSSSASATLATANQLIANATIATNAGVPKTHVDASTDFGEVCSQTQSGAWLGHVGAITDTACNPTGRGWFMDASTLDLQDIVSGTWTPHFRHVTSANSYTCDMYSRAFIYNAGTYTLIGTAVLSGQTVNNVIANYTWAGTSFGTASFPTGSKLYIDLWHNILTTTCVSGNTVQVNQSSLAGDGLAAVNVVTPGYQPSPVALSVTMSGVGTINAVLARNVYFTPTFDAVGTLTATLSVSSGVALTATLAGTSSLTATLTTVAPPVSDNPYGVTIGLNPGCGSAASNYANWSLLFADMKASSTTWLRFQLSWCSIQLNQSDPSSAWSWGPLDNAVQQCNANGINILYTLRGAPTWALTTSSQKASTEPFYLPDPTMFAAFATEVATRYDGHHGHGHIDAFGYNEDFSIHFNSTTDTLTLNQTLTSGVPATTFTINAAGFTPQAGSVLYFAGYNSANTAVIATTHDVTLGATTVTCNSFTPNATYTAGTTINIAYIGYNDPNYPGLYGNGTALTTSNKCQPARDMHFAAPVVKATTAAIRTAYPGVKIGMPCIWWPQPANPGGIPNTPVSNYTASVQTLYNENCGGLFDFLDFHFYSNAIAPTVGSHGVSTIGHAMTDLRNVAIANGDETIPIYCTEFGWQVTNDVADYATQATYYQQVVDAVRAGGTNPNGKAFFFTLDYGTTPSQSSLVKWNGTGYTYEPAWTTWNNYIDQYPTWAPISTGTYNVTIGGQVVYVIAGSLTIENAVGRRTTASFSVLSDTNTHFYQYQQVSVFDQNNALVFSGYITSPKEQRPGFQPFLVHTITCTDQTWLAVKRIVATYYLNQTVGFIVNDLLTTILSQEGVVIGQIVDPGLVIPQATFSYSTVAQALDAMVTQAMSSGTPYYWQIDQFKQLWFVPYTTVTGPSADGTTIDDGTLSGMRPSVTRSNVLYRNTQYVAAGNASTSSINETRKGDGNTRSWTMGYPLASAPTITVNAVSKTVGLKGTSGSAFYWAAGDAVIAQDSGQAVLISTDTLSVTYVGQYPSVFNSSDATLIAAQAALDGTSGKVENVLDDNTIISATDGLARVGQLISRYGVQALQFDFATLATGYAASQLIAVNYPPHGLNNVQMLVESVVISDSRDMHNLWSEVKAILGPYDTSWQQYFGNILQQTQPNSINVGQSGGSQVSTPNFTGAWSVSMSFNAVIVVRFLPGTSVYPSTTLYPTA